MSLDPSRRISSHPFAIITMEIPYANPHRSIATSAFIVNLRVGKQGLRSHRFTSAIKYKVLFQQIPLQIFCALPADLFNPGYCDLLLFRRRKTFWGDRITVDVISAPVVTEDRSRLRDRIVKLFGDGGRLLSMIALSWIETRLAWSYAIAFRKFVFNYWHLPPGHLEAINNLMTESYSESETFRRLPLGPCAGGCPISVLCAMTMSSFGRTVMYCPPAPIPV